MEIKSSLTTTSHHRVPTGWTIHNAAGLTAAADWQSISVLSKRIMLTVQMEIIFTLRYPGLTTNEVITFWMYTTGLGNVYFLANSAGKGQMGRLDSRGGGNWAGLAATTSGSVWNAPSRDWMNLQTNGTSLTL